MKNLTQMIKFKLSYLAQSYLNFIGTAESEVHFRPSTSGISERNFWTIVATLLACQLFSEFHFLNLQQFMDFIYTLFILNSSPLHLISAYYP